MFVSERNYSILLSFSELIFSCSDLGYAPWKMNEIKATATRKIRLVTNNFIS